MKQKEIPSGGFYWERKLYQSDAFLSLSKNAMKLLISLMDARKRTRGADKAKKRGKRVPEFINLDRIIMPYTVLNKTYQMHDDAISRAIDELLAKGFIAITKQGGTGKHTPTLYALIEDFKTWEKGIVYRTRPKDVRRGYQGKRLGATAPKNCNSGNGKNNSRSQNGRLIHAAKRETKTEFRLPKGKAKENCKNEAI